MTDRAASDAVADIGGDDVAGVETVAADAHPARACGACGRAFTGKAGRVVDGKPVCPTCGNRLRPKIACESCGRPTARPRRKAGIAALICEGCLYRGTHATCSCCGRHRRIAAEADVGRPLCAGCASPAPATRSCPDCSATVPGRGHARCAACSLKHLVASRVQASASLVTPTWARSLYEAFCAWEGLPRNQYGVVRRSASYARCFIAIGAGCACAAEITQARLISLLGNEGMRRDVLVMRFLAERFDLTFDPETAEDMAEARRIESILAASAGQGWAADLGAYHAHLAAADVRLKTVRVYLTAVAGLLTAAEVAAAADLRQGHVQAYVQRRPGHRANLARFASWLPSVGGPSLEVHRRREQNHRRQERELLRSARRLLEALTVEGDPRRGRALLAAAVAQVYQVPLSRTLALRTAEVREDGNGGVILWQAGLQLELIPELAVAFRLFAGSGGRLVFPGRNGAQPLSTAAVLHHVEGLRRVSAVSTLAEAGPNR